MKLLEEKILKDGKVLDGDVLKVDSFLNHQIDVEFVLKMAQDIKEKFKDYKINKILTIEASGIGLACLIATAFDNCKVVFAKKSQTKNLAGDLYTSTVESFTHGHVNEVRVCKDYLGKDDTVLIVDDFLARGAALNGLLDIVEQSKATLAGIAIFVEKGFQGGGDKLRQKGINLYSMAIIDSMDSGNINFR